MSFTAVFIAIFFLVFAFVIVFTLKCAVMLIKYIGGLFVGTSVVLYLYWIGGGIPILILIGFGLRRYLVRN